ncbi:MAG: restriction endonuclease subunit S [Thiomargarita sp.]|nr:restriction endonuclease subunit S [Thiomargarita sp.]
MANGELIMKKGYKRTEIGVIPVDWKIVTLNELTDKIGDGIHSTPNYSSDGEYFFVNGNNLTDGKIVISKETKNVSKKEFLIHKRVLNNSTILLSINGTIGNIAFYNNEKIVLGKSAAYINLNEKIEKELLYQLLQTEFIEKYFNDELTGSTIKNLGLGSIRNTPIPLPPLPEQKAIAEVLSDTDNLIQALEKRIAKKRLIKQGAMQKLLTPKKDWGVKKLGDYVKISSGESPSNFVFKCRGVPYFKVEQLNNCNKYQKETPYFIETNNTIIKGSIIFPKRGASIFLNKIRILADDSFMDTNLMTLTVSDELSHEFLFYVLSYFELWKIADTTSIPQINNKHIVPFEIPFPPLGEQTHIATILSDMDSEIEALEKKRAKYKQLKQGLMQNLLTGKIRLI